MSFARKCICGKRGATLIELVAAMAVLSIVVLGLGSVYVFSMDQWEKAFLRIRLQQAGSFVIEEMVRTLQSATEIEEKDDEVLARVRVPDLYIDSVTSFRRAGGTLEKDGSPVFPQPGLEFRWQKAVMVKSLEVETPLNPDSLFRLRVVLSLSHNTQVEEMAFTTGFYLRNAPVADAGSAEGNP